MKYVLNSSSLLDSIMALKILIKKQGEKEHRSSNKSERTSSLSDTRKLLGNSLVNNICKFGFSKYASIELSKEIQYSICLIMQSYNISESKVNTLDLSGVKYAMVLFTLLRFHFMIRKLCQFLGFR